MKDQIEAVRVITSHRRSDDKVSSSRGKRVGIVDVELEVARVNDWDSIGMPFDVLTE